MVSLKAMKQILLVCAVVALVGCGKKEASDPEATYVQPATVAKVIEEAVRKAAKKPTGELTKEDYGKVTRLSLQRRKLTEVPKELENLTQLKVLDFRRNQLTDLKGLEKLTQLEFLMLTKGSFALTQAQIDELQKALPKCEILALPTK